MKTKKQNKKNTYKRKKNKKLINKSSKKNNKFTRKYIQKGGTWIQPLFYIYDDKFNFNNCPRTITYDPYINDFIDFQERTTLSLMSFTTVRNTEEEKKCINKYKYFNTYFLPYQEQKFYLQHITEYKSNNTPDNIAQLLILGYLNIFNYLFKIWKTNNINNLIRHIRSDAFIGNKNKVLSNPSNLSITKENLYKNTFDLISPTITEAIASGNDCSEYIDTTNTFKEHKHFLWSYFFYNLPNVDKIFINEYNKQKGNKLTQVLKDIYYDYVKIRTPEDLLNLFTNYKPHISTVSFISGNDNSISLLNYFYGNNINVEQYRKMMPQIKDKDNQNFYVNIMNTDDNILEMSEYFIPEITDCFLVVNKYQNITMNNDIMFFMYDLGFKFTFNAEKTVALLNRRSNENLYQKLESIYGDSFERPSSIILNNVPIIYNQSLARENFINCLYTILFSDAIIENKPIILAFLHKYNQNTIVNNQPSNSESILNIINNNSENLIDAINNTAINSLSLDDIILLLINLQKIEGDLNMYINKLLSFVNRYDIMRNAFSLYILGFKQQITVKYNEINTKFVYNGIFSKYCDNTNDWTQNTNTTSVIWNGNLILPQDIDKKQIYISIVNTFISENTDNMVQNYLVMSNDNNYDNTGAFVFNNDNNIVVSYMIFICELTAPHDDDNVRQLKLADIIQVNKIDENNVFTNNILIIWKNKSNDDNNTFIERNQSNKYLYKCLKENLLTPIFSIQSNDSSGGKNITKKIKNNITKKSKK